MYMKQYLCHAILKIPLLVLAWGSLWFMLWMNKRTIHWSLQWSALWHFWKSILFVVCEKAPLSFTESAVWCCDAGWSRLVQVVSLTAGSTLLLCFSTPSSFIIIIIFFVFSSLKRTCPAWPLFCWLLLSFIFECLIEWNTSSPHFVTCLEWNILQVYSITLRCLYS